MIKDLLLSQIRIWSFLRTLWNLAILDRWTRIQFPDPCNLDPDPQLSSCSSF